jgi:hypothetical protein
VVNQARERDFWQDCSADEINSTKGGGRYVTTYKAKTKKPLSYIAHHTSRMVHDLFYITFHAPRFSLAILLLFTLTLCNLRSVPVAADEPAPPEPVVLQADTSGVVLEWRAPAFSQRRIVGGDGRSYVALDAPGWDQTEVVGQPQLPKASVLAVVPPVGDVTASAKVLARGRYELRYPVVPSPQSVAVVSPPVRIERAWAWDAKAYNGANPHSELLYPRQAGDIVTLEEAGWLRGRRLVRLTFLPMQFIPASTAPGRVDGPSLEVASRVRVELRFESAAAGAQAWASDDPFTSILQDAVVNPAQVAQFVRPRQAAPAATPLSPPADTEYLIISHSDFITTVAPLAAHRAISGGLKVFSTTVEAIYDVYSGGVVTATAIRDYIYDAYHAPVSPALTYVLLVGDGTRSSSGDQYVPPFRMMLDPAWWPGEPWLTASDNRFVTVDGPDDNLADVFIGRLPVNSVSQAVTVVDKILSYELAPPQWPWNERVWFFAGNEHPNEGETFHDDSDWLYDEVLPATYTGRRVYFCTDSCTQSYHYEDITAAHDATVQGLNFGGLLASYVGHSSWLQWAVDDAPGGTYAPMFHRDDVASLHNGEALPVVLEMTCYTSDFSHPDGDTLDESLVRQANGGAVATWGSTTLGRTTGHNIMHWKFFDTLFTSGVTELGALIKAAELELADRVSTDLDLLDTFVLLGDPAMDFNLTAVSWPHEVFLPVTLRAANISSQ